MLEGGLMQKISEKNLEKIVGGEVSVWIYLIVTSIIIFLSGVIEGYTHPEPCKKIWK